MAKRRGRPSSPNAPLARSAGTPNSPSTATTNPPSHEAISFSKKFSVGWLILSCVLPVGLCLARLNDDLWYDEIYTLSFAEQSSTSIATDYSAPNNHLLFTMLLSPTYAIYANNAALRLPSFVCTLATLACVFYLGRRVGGVPTAVAAVTVLGLNQMFLGHTMQVRGYSLSMALATALGLLVLQVDSRSWARTVAIVVLAAAMMYTIPTNAVFAASLAITAIIQGWLHTRSWKNVLLEAATWSAAAALAAVLYLPVYEQVLAARNTATEGTWSSTLGLTFHFYWAALHDYALLVPIAFLGFGKIIQTTFFQRSDVPEPMKSPESNDAKLSVVWFFIIMLTSLFFVTALLRTSPFVRVYCPLLPFVALFVGWMVIEGTRAALTWWAHRRRWPDPRTSVVAFVSAAMIMVATLPWLATYPTRLAAVCTERFAQDGYFNYYSANYSPSQVVAYLRSKISPNQPYIVCFDDADMLNLRWYLAHGNVVPGRLRETPQGESVAQVFLVLPPRPRFERVAFETGIPEETLRSLPMVADFGYYKVFSTPELIPLNPVSPQEAPQ